MFKKNMNNVVTDDVIMMFPAYAGGKFISNCLCLSKHFVPCTTNFDLSKVADIDYRLNIILKTLPNKDQMPDWLQYEFGEHDRSGDFYKLVKSMKLRCIRTSHGFNADYINEWNPATIIKLIHYEKFRNLAYSLKKTNRPFVDEDSRERYEQIKGSTWPTYKEFAAVGFDSRKLVLNEQIQIDINQFYRLGSTRIQTHLFNQNTIFNKQTFLNEMEKLYSTLDLDDFNEEATSIFYTKYAILHNI